MKRPAAGSDPERDALSRQRGQSNPLSGIVARPPNLEYLAGATDPAIASPINDGTTGE